MKPPISAPPPALAAEDLLPYTDRLLRWAVRHTSNLHEAEDLVQDTLLHALAHIHELRDPDRLSSWLYRIAERRLVDLIRQDRSAEVPLLIDPLAPDPEVTAMEIGRHADLQRAVRRLPRSLRLPVRLHYIQGRPLQEVAQALGTTITAIKSRLYRARHKLREPGSW